MEPEKDLRKLERKTVSSSPVFGFFF